MIKKLLTPIFLLFGIFINAQSVYNFEAENSAYQNLIGSTSLNNGEVWDDPEYAIPLGFNFTISTHTFNTIFIVEWSAGGVLSSKVQDNGILPLFVPIGQDIVSKYNSSGISTSPLSYKTEGSAGNRILKIEWQNLGFIDDSTQNDFMNIQMWLYESSNIIEYRYGPNSINNPSESFEGGTGPDVGLLTSLDIDNDELLDVGFVLTGNTANPTVLVFQAGDDYDGGELQGAIPDGTVYRFRPQPLSVEDFSQNDFQIYPNPASEYLHIKTQLSNYNCSIYNSLGQKVNATLSENKIDISNLSNGIYFLKIETETGAGTKKFIKQS
ncbi:T9SS type A sorting domain-containing protein [Aequorivita todarodis]|uniref:T9SS type A sorting domain-containing protein n=1 Tax=Aequorivita todarodis TaxID=2036821 RepID=UPI00234FEDFA|nr:T9SS type A sorting domain-containing protein [Aequorivita todarodis]MDC8000206.1 T9SS type A sorting domain-containing protein [Aequorivita todarodis]